MWSFAKLVGWGVLMIIIWPIVAFLRYCRKKPRVDNCVTWSVRRWEEQPGSYLVIRWCRSSRTDMKWPHFMWMNKEFDQHMKHFVPLNDDQDTKFLPALFFEGKVVTGDNENDNLEN